MNEELSPQGWLHRRGLAKRGFATKDIPEMLGERRSLECVSEARE